MRRLALFLIAVPLFAASTFRVDPQSVMTTASNAPVGGFPTLYAVPGATIALCTDAACSIPAVAYTDATGNTACPSYAPVTLAGTSVCTSFTGPQGQFGFWLTPGVYYYTVTPSSGQRFGPYPITSSTFGVTQLLAGAGISVNNGGINAVTVTNTGALSFNARTGAIVPTTGDYTAAQVTNAADTTGNYSNPAWITGLNLSKILGLSVDTFVQGTAGNPQAGSLVNCVAAGGVYQYATASHTFSCHTLAGADIPAINVAAAGNGGITGTMGFGNGGTNATTRAAALAALLSGSTQGNASVVQMAGTNSGVSGAGLCNDAGGNTTTSGCTPPIVLPAATAGFQQLRTKYNSTVTYEFAPELVARAPDYNYAAITPSSPATLTGGGGAQTVTLPTCPLGVSSASFAPVYISGGVGTAEAITPSGGTCTSGLGGGTIVIAPLNNHSGAWTVTSATAGIQEALNWLTPGGAGTVILNPAGTATLHAQVAFPAGRYTINGQSVTGVSVTRAADYLGGYLFNCGVNANAFVALRNFQIANTNGTVAAILIAINGNATIDNVQVNGGAVGVENDSGGGMQLIGNWIMNGQTSKGLWFHSTNGTQVQNVSIMGGYIFPTAAAVGMKLESVDLMQVSGTSIGAGLVAIQIAPAASPSFVNNIYFSNVEMDAATVSCVQFGGGTTGSAQGIRFQGGHCHGNGNVNSQNGFDIGASSMIHLTDLVISGMRIAGWGQAGIFQFGDATIYNISYVGNIITDNDTSNNATYNTGVYMSVGVNKTLFSGNQIKSPGAYTGHQAYGIKTASTASDLTIVGNDLSTNGTGAISFALTPTTSVVANNKGLTDVAGTVGDAATVALPLNPYFTLTGTGSTVTAFTGVMPIGYTWTMVPTNGSPPAFTASASVGNACAAPVQNFPYTLTSDGTKVYIYGKGC